MALFIWFTIKFAAYKLVLFSPVRACPAGAGLILLEFILLECHEVSCGACPSARGGG